MQKPTIILQDVFLNQVRKEHVAVTIHLINGFQIKGFVKGFDNFTVILECEGKQLMVYKHAISTITPAKSVFFSFSEKPTYEKQSYERSSYEKQPHAERQPRDGDAN